SSNFPNLGNVNEDHDITLVPSWQCTGEKHLWEMGIYRSAWTDECYVNTIEACIMHHLMDIQSYFPIIFCIEISSNVTSALGPCLAAFQPELSVKTVMDCVNGDLGNKLMHENAMKTDSLNPPHDYVPWVVVNGQHNDTLQDRAISALLNLICEMYTGTKPEACSGKGMTPLKRDSVCLN
ncbi:hypothetical protein GDO81_001008, partial [Engystomops pustulosus]